MLGLTKKNSLKDRPKILEHLFFLDDVSVSFGAIQALKSVQLFIDQGEIIFLTGASGAGKSTLLKLLAGEIAPDSGRIMTSSLKRKAPFISRVFQDLRLVEDLSCLDNIMFSYDPKIYKTKKDFLIDMHELCRVLGMSDRLHIKISDANGGLKQKVALVRALLSKPDVLLADELSSSLDADNARKIFDLLNLYNVKRGLTVVWASHNGDLVKSFSGRIIHLDAGKLVYSGHACFI